MKIPAPVLSAAACTIKQVHLILISINHSGASRYDLDFSNWLSCVPPPVWCQTNGLTHWGRDKMATISQTVFSDTFLRMKSFVFWLKFHLSLLLRVQLMITHYWFNTLRPRQNGCHFADDTFKRIFLNENVRISIKISLKFVPKVPINNILSLVQIMAWRWPGDKPLS